MASASEAAEEGNASSDVMQDRDGVGFLGSLRHFPLRRFSISPKGDSGAIFRYSHTRFSSRRFRKRIVFKNGDCNVVQGNVAKRRRRYLQDIFTTLVDVQWRWTLLVFALNFLLSWLGFAIVWWIIAFAHGDLEGLHQRERTEEHSSWMAGEVTKSGPETTVESLLVEYGSGGGDSTLDGGEHSGVPIEGEEGKEDSAVTDQERTPCVTDIHGFASCFLFSVETQHTIGYGSRSTTEECPEAIFVMCLQSITGVMIQAFMVGIVFAKLSRPKKRTQTLLFSRNAVVCQRDGRLCFMFRVGDMRKSHIIEAHVRAQLIRRKVTKEGELLPFFQQELRVGCGNGGEDRLLFIWPTLIVHAIDDTSPLYAMSAADLSRERLEIVVILEGVIESTGMTTQARSSYLPGEILWGNRFRTLVTFKKESGGYEVDYSLFNDTYKVDTPLCSAKTLDDLRVLQQRAEDFVAEPKFLARRPPPQFTAMDVPLFGTVDEEEEEDEEAELSNPQQHLEEDEEVGTTGKLAAAVALRVGIGVAALTTQDKEDHHKGGVEAEKEDDEEEATSTNWRRQNGGGGRRNSLHRGTADTHITQSFAGLSGSESVI